MKKDLRSCFKYGTVAELLILTILEEKHPFPHPLLHCPVQHTPRMAKFNSKPLERQLKKILSKSLRTLDKELKTARQLVSMVFNCMELTVI
jgi:hypothetical protein